MSSGAISSRTSVPIRKDLQVLPLAGGRDCVVIDDIGGRFSRTKRAIWAQLRDAEQGQSTERPSTSSWQQAAVAGWTRTRATSGQRGGWSPLSIKIPVASIDPIAKRLVAYSDWVFAPNAILFWLFAALTGLMMLAVRWEHWAGSVPSLGQFISNMHPWSVAAIFVFTKSVHELGHATACRRLGSRPGVAGLWFLCFMPCPFVDVTEVWRQPSAMRRAAVMAAGMMAEGVVCVIAIWVWVISDSPTVMLAAMNIILICGVSTILFNANPLMRYDGYFILSDFVNSSNLRIEANREWLRMLSLPLRRWWHLGRRSTFLVSYHLAASVYRVFIFVAIAAMILAIADQFGVWRIAAIGIGLLTLMSGLRQIRSVGAVWSGSGKWSVVPGSRRRWMVAGTLGVFLLVLFVPLPRYRHVAGRLEAKDVEAVYLPEMGVVESVDVKIGDHVTQDQTMVMVADPDLEIQLVSVSGKAEVLKHRARSARLASLYSKTVPSTSNNASPTSFADNQWDILDAASAALAVDRQELLDRKNRLRVVSPVDGWVLPGNQSSTRIAETEGLDETLAEAADPLELKPTVGQLAMDREVWCRVATSKRLQVSIPLDADDHDEVQIGCRVRVLILGDDSVVQQSEILAVSPIRSTNQQGKLVDTHGYQAIADIAPNVDVTMEQLVRWDGAECQVVVHLPLRPLWQDLIDMARDAMGR